MKTRETTTKPRYVLGLEYDGTAFCGWQRQPHSPSVQEQLEKALGQVGNEPIRTVAAGRTDTGVHATMQVVDFVSSAKRTSYQWQRGLNANLPASIRVLWVQPVADDFSARFSATARYYRYIIFNRAIAPGLLAGFVSWQPRPLAIERMSEAAQYLLGVHDFSAFRAAACQAKSPRRHLQTLTIERHGDFICMDVMADGFLHHMVRNFAGSLMAVGLGEREPVWIKQVLTSVDRRQAGMTAAPGGLYLVKVDYPAIFCLPDSSPFPVFW